MNEKETSTDFTKHLLENNISTPHHKEQDWEKKFIKKFFVYNLKENTPAGAEKEAIKFIHSLLTQQREAVRKEIERIQNEIPKTAREPFELAENVGKRIVLDDVLKVLN